MKKIKPSVFILIFATIISLTPEVVTATELPDAADTAEAAQPAAGGADEAPPEPAAAELSYDDLLIMIDNTNETIRNISKEMDDLNLRMKETEEKIEKNEYNISHYDELSKRTKEDSDALILSIYKNQSGAAGLNYLFESKSFADFLNRNYYSEKVLTAFYDKLSKYKDRATYEKEQRVEIKKLDEENKEKLSELTEKKAELDLALSDLNDRLSEYERRQTKAALLAEFEAREYEIMANEPVDYISMLSGYNISEWEFSDSGEAGYYYEDPVTYTEEELKLLAGLVEAEAGGSGYAGMVAVGSVVMNHLKDSRFPNTITEVIYAPKHFSPVWSGRLATILSRGPAEESYRAARDVLAGKRNTDKLCFKSVEYAMEHGISGIQIGDNVFHDMPD